MSDSQREHHVPERKKQPRPSDRSVDMPETPQLNQPDEKDRSCCSSSMTSNITPEANTELQRTIAELDHCATGNARLSTLCSRYVETLNEKHRLAQRLREERALRTKVLETKNRLVTVCQRLQEQTLELRREACGNEWSTNGDIMNKRTQLGMVRKYVDYTKFADKGRDVDSFNNGEFVRENVESNSEDEETIQKKRALLSEGSSTVTMDITGHKLKSSTNQSKLEVSDLRMDAQIAALLKATSQAQLSENEVAGEMKIAPNVVAPSRDRLSLVTVTRSDIPPTHRCPTDRKIGVSWASMDLTRR